MKNLNQIFRIAWAVSIFALTSTLSLADGKGEGVLIDAQTVGDEKKAVFSVTSLPEGDVTVRVTDARGNMIYTEKSEGSVRYAKVYDFSQTENGVYTVEVKAEAKIGTQSVKYRVHVYDGKIDIKTVDRLERAELVRRLEGKTFRFAFAKPGQFPTQARVRLFDADGALLFEDRYEGFEEAAKLYDLRHLPNGRYMLEVHTDTGKFYDYVSVR